MILPIFDGLEFLLLDLDWPRLTIAISFIALLFAFYLMLLNLIKIIIFLLY